MSVPHRGLLEVMNHRYALADLIAIANSLCSFLQLRTNSRVATFGARAFQQTELSGSADRVIAFAEMQHFLCEASLLAAAPPMDGLENLRSAPFPKSLAEIFGEDRFKSETPNCADGLLVVLEILTQEVNTLSQDFDFENREQGLMDWEQAIKNFATSSSEVLAEVIPLIRNFDPRAADPKSLA